MTQSPSEFQVHDIARVGSSPREDRAASQSVPSRERSGLGAPAQRVTNVNMWLDHVPLPLPSSKPDEPQGALAGRTSPGGRGQRVPTWAGWEQIDMRRRPAIWRGSCRRRGGETGPRRYCSTLYPCRGELPCCLMEAHHQRKGFSGNPWPRAACSLSPIPDLEGGDEK